jgi:hypothetical protein
MVLRDLGHAQSLGQVLTDEAIGVFVGPTLPRVMGCGEVETNVSGALDLRVAVKLSAIVGSDGLERND